MKLAQSKRDASYGDVITYSPKVFLPLTKLCRDRCGYCTFAQPPARLEAPFMTLDDVAELSRAGAAMGCTEALFTLGERPELRYDIAKQWLSDHGYVSTVEYLVEACPVALTNGLLPHANAGALLEDELAALRRVTASQGMMLESLRDDLEAHRSAPDKSVQRRLDTLRWAGELRIPFTTGILVGIGENRDDRRRAIDAIGGSHAQFGHVQEVIVQNFLPKPGTGMAGSPPCPSEEHLWSIEMVREVLPADISVQAPPNLTNSVATVIDAGVNDLGGISPLTVDHVNPERPWPAVDALAEELAALGRRFVPRLPVYRQFIDSTWLATEVLQAVHDLPSARPIGEG